MNVKVIFKDGYTEIISSDLVDVLYAQNGADNDIDLNR